MRNSVFARVALVVLAVGMAIGTGACSILFGPSYRDSNGVPTATATIKSTDLRVGDCVYNVSDSKDKVGMLQVVPCSSSHEAEVYAVATGVDNDLTSLKQFCTDQFKPYVGVDFNDSNLDVTYIHGAATEAKTDLKCIVYSQGNMVSTSYKGSQL